MIHKERNFILSLKSKLNSHEFDKLEKLLEDKWEEHDKHIILQATLNETWPGSKYRKALTDMNKLGWIDNLTFVELAHKAAQL